MIFQSGDIKTNGYHEDDTNEDNVSLENIAKNSKTGENDETSEICDLSDQVDKKVCICPRFKLNSFCNHHLNQQDMEPHCSKVTDEEEEDDSDEDDEDSDDDKWNSDENDRFILIIST